MVVHCIAELVSVAVDVADVEGAHIDNANSQTEHSADTGSAHKWY